MSRRVPYVLGLGCWIAFWSLSLAPACPAWSAEGGLTLSGKPQQGGILFGKVPAGSRVLFEGQPVRVANTGQFVIGFGRSEPARTELTVHYPSGASERRTLRIEQRKYDVQRIDGLPDRQVTPSAEDLPRIRKEAALIRESRRRDDPRTDFLGHFIWPVEGRVSGVYGSQRVLNGKPKRPHYGVDVAAGTGTPVRAPATGTVSLVHADMYFTGGTVMLDHGHGVSSIFIHLSEIHVAPEQRVERGEIIAEVGATGRATGPHLHWGMNWFERRLDPQLTVQPMGAAVH